MILTTEILTAVLAEQASSAANLGRNLTVVLCDSQGREVFVHRADGASWITSRVATTKARTAVAFGMSTADFGAFRERSPEVAAVAAEGLPFAPTGLGGGVPIVRNGVVIAGVAVSGATAEQDAEVATRIAALLAPQNA